MNGRVRGDDDAGFSLIEVLSAVAVMGVFLTIFTSSLILMFGSSNRSQAVAHTSQEVNDAFTWLDRQVRYASYIGQPGQDTADQSNWYVEFQNSNTTPATCYQLRVDQSAEQLQVRSWADGGSPGSWQPLASGVTNGGSAGSDRPFAVTDASSAVGSAQLSVDLVTQEGSGSDSATTQDQLNFTALNTNTATPIGGVCTGWRP